MFCPKCAADNIQGARFCRACGADISLVPQALSGNLPAQQGGALQPAQPMQPMTYMSRRARRRMEQPPSIEQAIRNIFVGMGFIFVSLAILLFVQSGRLWWWAFLIPAFSTLGGGVAEYVRFKNLKAAAAENQSGAGQPYQGVSAARVSAEIPPSRGTGELYPQPPSVTEGTTRHLGAEAPTRAITPPGETPHGET